MLWNLFSVVGIYLLFVLKLECLKFFFEGGGKAHGKILMKQPRICTVNSLFQEISGSLFLS